MSETITMTRDELEAWGQNIATTAATTAVDLTLIARGLKLRSVEPWIYMHRATKFLSRKRIETAMEKGLIRSKVDYTKKTHNTQIFVPDLQKLLNKPIIL